MKACKLSRRFWAYTFDCIIVQGIYCFIILVLKTAGMDISLQGLLERNLTALIVFYSTYGLIFFVYETSFLVSKLSATPGKLILGLEVCCYSGGNIYKVFMRSLVKAIATSTNLSSVFFVITLFSENRQSPHDLVAQTLVIDKNNYGATNKENTVDIFEEMETRGVKTYDEQIALMNELKIGKKSVSKEISYAWIGVIFLVFSFISGALFSVCFYPDIVTYAQNKYITTPRFKYNGIQVDEDIARKYIGLWSSSDKKVGFRVYYLNGTMYINTNQRAFKFRFDNDMNLFLTDGNNNEYEISVYNDTMTMTRPIDVDLQMKYKLYKINESNKSTGN